MPRLIQTAPVGLLSALTSKDGGIGPAALLDDVRGSVDLLQFYGLNFRRSRILEKTAAEMNAAGVVVGGWRSTSIFGTGPTNLVVPDGQLWHVLGVQLELDGINGAVRGAAGINFKLPVVVGGANNGVQIGPFSAATTGGANPNKVTAGGLCDIWVLPGGAVAFFLDQFAIGLNDADFKIGIDYELFAL